MLHKVKKRRRENNVLKIFQTTTFDKYKLLIIKSYKNRYYGNSDSMKDKNKK